ncbi:hypothetical protein [Flavobacterium denitrificans]|uniref:hypothetical protein n=1 Tax=Flavobacterium denitrificans TaxID=281361 RepID=UPI000417BBD5|nr:hypothetical protein [Flavobacterium denitrificans]
MSTQIQAQKKVENGKTLPIVKPTEPTQAEKKTATLALIEKFAPEPPKTAEDRIQAVAHFEALSKRFKTLKEKWNDLKMFEAGNDKTNAKITFKNAQGFEFEIRNSIVIDKLNREAQNELKILLDEAENEILTFQI